MAGSDYSHDSSRIADPNGNWQVACETPVLGWTKTNELIVALVAVCDAHAGATEAFKMQWSKNNVDWNDLGVAGELVQGTATVLVDGNPVASPSGCASQTVEDSEEVEGDNQTGNLATTGQNCVEVQVAVDSSGGIDGQKYYFRLYSTTESAALGTAGATLTLLSPKDAYSLADVISTQLVVPSGGATKRRFRFWIGRKP